MQEQDQDHSELPIKSNIDTLRSRIGETDFEQFFNILIENIIFQIEFEDNPNKRELLIALQEAAARIYTQIKSFNYYIENKNPTLEEFTARACEYNRRIASDYSFIANHQDVLF